MNLDDIRNALGTILGMLGVSQEPIILGGPRQVQTPIQTTIQTPIQTPIPQQVPVQPIQTTLQQNINTDEIQRKLTNGFINLYGKNTPALSYIPQIINAIKTNQFHRNNPYLAAAQLVAESSGAGNITRPNNPTNWGIAVPGNNEIFAKMSPHDVFDKYLTGIAGRDRNYKEFDTGRPLNDEQFMNLSRKYVGPADTTYGQRLKEHINYFENQ